MWTSSTAEDSLQSKTDQSCSFSRDGLLTSTAETLKRAIHKNPEIALLISTSIGVLLGCLIKRR
jgi:ElaB/YqjD/DUF883 family membrane-anchored ribosome-binding protein